MSPSSQGLVVAWMGSPSATRREAVAIRGCHLLQSLRSFHKWYPRLPSGQPPADGGEKCRGCQPEAALWVAPSTDCRSERQRAQAIGTGGI